MIVGIGIDLVHIPRIARAVARWGDRFTGRVFTPEELGYCLRHRQPEWCLALRFAAKEACSKALGTGIRRGVAWRHMAVFNEPSGRPVLHLSGGALKRAEDLKGSRWHLSLSHDGEYAIAVVIIDS
jgi:holo-[acyl-carrier protein] synthase